MLPIHIKCDYLHRATEPVSALPNKINSKHRCQADLQRGVMSEFTKIMQTPRDFR